MILLKSDVAKFKELAKKTLLPLKPVSKKTVVDPKFLLIAKRSVYSSTLPKQYLVYFLFANLLNYKNLGKFEKIAWSFPVDYKGKAFLIEHRKFGIGIFIHEKEDEPHAKEIADRINKVVKLINSYYDFLAEKAVLDSKLNVRNNNKDLFNRYNYLKELYKKQHAKYQVNQGKFKIIKNKTRLGDCTTYTPLDFKYQKHSSWLAISCIEAFFSWTEHLFVHLAIVANGMYDGKEVSDLIGAEWKEKFKESIGISDKVAKNYYNELLIIRQQMRNFVAHGSFGKDGNAFDFHSEAGAVPVLMSHNRNKNNFSLYGSLKFNDENVIKLIENFINFLGSGPLKPAMYYTQEHEMPTILTFARSGVYSEVTKDMGLMEEFVKQLSYEIDNAANMDW